MLSIKEYRTKQGLTQQQVSVLANVKRSYYSLIELGYKQPSPRVAMRIADALKFDWTLFYPKSETENDAISDPANA